MMNKRMTVVLCLLMALCLVFGLAAAEQTSGKLKIVATTYALSDIAKQVAGDLAEVDYLPEAAEADLTDVALLLCVGGEGDAWADALEGVSVVRLLDGIETIEGDTDALTIPVNNMICASYVADELGALDSANNGVYQENLSKYLEELIELDLLFREVIQEGTKVCCNDGSMLYFLMEYGVDVSDSADAVELRTYNNPTEEELQTPYIELMKKNLEALAGSAK